MKCEGLFPHSQQPATDPQESSPCQPHPNFLNVHFNIILPSLPSSSKWSLSIRSVHRNTLCTFPISIRARRPAYLNLHCLKTRIILGEEEACRTTDTSLCLCHSPVTWSLLTRNTFRSTLFSKTLNPCSSLNIRDVQCSNSIENGGQTALKT
jgi:hypothetical protein